MKEKELQLVTFEQAKKLKALNFDWDICRYDNCYSEDGDIEDYNGDDGHWDLDVNHSDTSQISAPTVALALKWMRDEKKIQNVVSMDDFGDYSGDFIMDNCEIFLPGGIECYEAAESALLDKLLTMLEKEEQQ